MSWQMTFAKIFHTRCCGEGFKFSWKYHLNKDICFFLHDLSIFAGAILSCTLQPEEGDVVHRKLQNAPSQHDQVCKSCICSEEIIFVFFSSAFLPCFKCDTGLPNAGKFSSTGKLLKLWTCCRDLDSVARSCQEWPIWSYCGLGEGKLYASGAIANFAGKSLDCRAICHF